MCEIGKAGRSFGDRKSRDTFTPLPATPSKEVHPVHRLVAEKNFKRTFVLKEPRKGFRPRLSQSPSLCRGTFYQTPVISRGCASPQAETQVRELESVRLDNIERTDTLAYIEFPFARGSRSSCFVQRNCVPQRYRCSPPEVRELVDFMEFLSSFRTGVFYYRAIT